MVDDSQTVGQLMIYICSQLGISHYEEYSLINDLPAEDREKTLTLKRQHDKTLNRDYKKMEELKKKLHTDDDSNRRGDSILIYYLILLLMYFFKFNPKISIH
jgi:talin